MDAVAGVTPVFLAAVAALSAPGALGAAHVSLGAQEATAAMLSFEQKGVVDMRSNNNNSSQDSISYFPREQESQLRGLCLSGPCRRHCWMAPKAGGERE